MKIKKWISAFCIAAGLTLTLPTFASIPGTSGLSMVSAAEIDSPNGSQNPDQLADGWYGDLNTGRYYIYQGVKVTGTQKIGGYTYYFNQSGNVVTGPVSINDATYYFSTKTGRLLTGVSGMAAIDQSTNTYYYFSSKKNGVIATNKWVTFKGRKFYAGADGKIMFGTIKVKNKLYHVTKNGRLTAYSKSTYDKKYYYASSNGVLKVGLQKINGKTYYFNPTNGARMTGSIKIGKYSYYFSTKTGSSCTGWVKLNKKYYYYNKNGRKLTGRQKINGKYYYLDPKKSGARVTSKWVKSGGYWYYYGSNGKMVSGLFKINGSIYRTNSKGQRIQGWYNYGSRKYYFDPNTGVMKTGWVTVGSDTYFMNAVSGSGSYGAMLTGWVSVSGKKYYFGNDGKLQKGKWVYINADQCYYLDARTGAVLTGTQTIDGKVYNLGATGLYQKTPTGAWLIKVNRAMNCITVYRGTTPIKAIVCSTAADRVSTPIGTFTLLDKLRWHELNGPTWGQYCSHITWNILFHSVPCSRYRDNHSMSASAFNKLGQPASGGCIRLTVADAKWIYENCPIGTKVQIYDDWSSPGPLGKPTAPKIPLTQSWDPTDPAA